MISTDKDRVRLMPCRILVKQFVEHIVRTVGQKMEELIKKHQSCNKLLSLEIVTPTTSSNK